MRVKTSDIQAFAPNIWIIETGPTSRHMGVMFTTRMTIVQLSPDGSLSGRFPCACALQTLTRITELGPVRYLVAATPRHVAAGSLAHALSRSTTLGITPYAVHVEEGAPATNRHTRGHAIPPGSMTSTNWLSKGHPLIEEVLFLHRASRTLILDDLHPVPSERKGEAPAQCVLQARGRCFSAGRCWA